jgi:dTDP-4-dehydrorhamnose 3,5-epimerase
VLSQTAIVLYKCDAFYNKQSEGGIRYDDSDLQIDWGIERGKEIVSDKDLQLSSFTELVTNFEL